GVIAVFQLINLPVEFDASNRAKRLLATSGLIRDGEEAAVMSKVLNAAAWTYVAATLGAVLTVLYYVIQSGLLGGQRREE
ncbi:MAG: zinc metallopeptidase, partial [Phycisphaerales bacterium]